MEHNVEVYERDGQGSQVSVSRSVATIERQYAPKAGDALVLLDDTGTPSDAYKIERLVEDNGHTVRRVVTREAG